MGSIKKIPGLILLFVAFPLFSQNNSAGPVSLAAEISRLEKIASSGGTAPREKCDAFLELARLYRLAGNSEAALKAYEGAAAVLPGNGRALLEQGRFLVSQGEYEKAAGAINVFFSRNQDPALVIQGRYLAAQLEAFRTGNTQPLAALVSDSAFTEFRSEIYYTLWKITGLLSWRSRLLLEFPQSPEAKIAASSIDSAPTPFWLLFPGRNSIAFASTPSAAGTPPSTVGAASPVTSPVSAARSAPVPAASTSAPAAVSPAASSFTEAAPPPSAPSSAAMLQTGLFGREANAEAMAGRLRQAGFTPRVFRRRVNNNDFWAVGVPGGSDMNVVIKELKDAGFESFPIR